jgi:hypothetical protein
MKIRTALMLLVVAVLVAAVALLFMGPITSSIYSDEGPMNCLQGVDRPGCPTPTP